MKTKIAFGDKDYTNVCGLHVPEDCIECKSFIVISIDFFFFFVNKYYLQVYLDNCTYIIVSKQTADYLDED